MSFTILTLYQQRELACEMWNTFHTFIRYYKGNSQIVESLLANVVHHTVCPLLHIFSTTNPLFYS
jgi:hypothetical protein